MSVQVSVTFSMCSWQVSEVTVSLLILLNLWPVCVADARAAYMFVKYKEKEYSIECHKTKTKVTALGNHKVRRQSSKPIKTQNNYT